jgi:hypothetical protein
MSGVSFTEGSGGSVDLDAIIRGGDAYMKRVKEFRDAQAAAEEARQNLGIGKEVCALRDEAARLVSQARTESDAIKNQALQDASKAQTSLNEWVMQTRDLTQKDRVEAAQLKAKAESLHKAARENHAASLQALNEANDKLSKAQAAHEAVLAASAALNKAVG